MKNLLLIYSSLILIFFSGKTSGGPSVITYHIHVDQFGYRCDAEKIAVISDPQTGFNSDKHFSPGKGTDKYEVRRWNDDVAVFTGTIKKWNSGNTHTQSGDKVWWFTFTSVSTPGEYYLYDKVNKVGSCKFRIGDNVYDDVMNAALKTFYYQRCGIAKSVPYAGTGWTDAACHKSTQQDLDCRLVSNPVLSTSRDLHGGWHDAGDYNKYVNFAWLPVTQMLFAYGENPSVWGDDAGLPESGNNIPDVLDEVRYELQWMLRMQEDDGSLLSLVGVQNFAGASPPSADAAFRRYGPATTAASLTGAACFAFGAIQFYSLNIAGATAFADTLQAAAVSAYNWAVAHPAVTYYNSGTLAAGEQEVDDYGRLTRKTAAACFLYQLTGTTSYRTVFDANYLQFHMIQWSYVYPFESTEQDVLLYYSKVPGHTGSVSSAIKSIYTNSTKSTNTDNLPAYNNKTDAYRAFMADWNYTWGNNEFKCTQGTIFTNMLEYNYNSVNATKYKNAAAGFVHYLHGVNPMDITYLSNMYAFGGDTCVNEFYNSWFTDGSALWDRTGVSTYGPPPGFIPGGANPSYSLDPCCPAGCGGANSLCNDAQVTPPLNQPIQKSFRDWNTNWQQNSWTITENAIYVEACYLKLLSWFLGGTCNEPQREEESVIAKSPSLLLFPNPAHDFFTIDNDDWENETGALRVIAMDGRIFLEQEQVQLPTHLSVTKLPPGSYVVVVQTGERMMQGKFVKD